MLSCKLDWIVEGKPYQQILDADKVTFTIVNLPQGTLVSEIRLMCSNAERAGLETNPSISARTHGTTPPRISSIGYFSTAAGELSHDQAFSVDDDETHAASLIVRATSLDESIVPSRSVEIRGVGRDRTVRVEPLVGVTGVATILVTVKDKEGLMASTTFEISVTPNWFYFFPTKGYAGSSTEITIHGAGFRTESMLYTCRLHNSDQSISTNAIVVSKSEMICNVPAWPSTAQIIAPQVLLNGHIVKQSEQAKSLAQKMSRTYKTQVRFYVKQLCN